MFAQQEAARIQVGRLLKARKRQRTQKKKSQVAEASEANRQGFLTRNDTAITQMMGWVTRPLRAQSQPRRQVQVWPWRPGGWVGDQKKNKKDQTTNKNVKKKVGK